MSTSDHSPGHGYNYWTKKKRKKLKILILSLAEPNQKGPKSLVDRLFYLYNTIYTCVLIHIGECRTILIYFYLWFPPYYVCIFKYLASDEKKNTHLLSARHYHNRLILQYDKTRSFQIWNMQPKGPNQQKFQKDLAIL